MSTSIVRADEYAGGLSDVLTMAKSLKLAGGFLPPHLKNEGEIVAVVLAGRELGIPPMASIRSIKLVKGNVTLDAAMQLALMVRAGAKVKWLKDGSDGEAVLRLERPGQEPHESKYTAAMARAAGLTGDNWQKHQPAMLRARAVTSAGKAYMPDVLAGVYLPDELPEEAPAPRAVRGLDDIAAGGQRAVERPTSSGSTSRSDPTAQSSAAPSAASASDQATISSATAASSTATTDGELLDATAWRERYEYLCEDLMQTANWIFGQEDEFGLPIPPIACPSFGPDGKRYANKRYDDPACVGFLRKRAQSADWLDVPADKRAWVLYAVARHEIAKAQAAAKETA
jgi:hypothetical protein